MPSHTATNNQQFPNLQNIPIKLTSKQQRSRSLRRIEVVMCKALVHSSVVPHHRTDRQDIRGQYADTLVGQDWPQVLGPRHSVQREAGHCAVEVGGLAHGDRLLRGADSGLDGN